MKKLLSILTALMLLVMPMSGYAVSANEIITDALADGHSVTVSTQVSMNEQLAEGSEQAAAVIGLYNSLTTVAAVQSNQVSFGICVNDKPVRIFLELGNNALYIHSDLLEQAVVLDTRELVGLARNYILPMLAQNGYISVDDVEKYGQWIEQLVSGEIPEELQFVLTLASSIIASALEKTENIIGSTENLTNWLNKQLMSITVMENPEADLPCKPAARTTYVLITDDLCELIDALSADLSASEFSVLSMVAMFTGVDISASISEAAQEIKKALSALDLTVCLDTYTDAEGAVCAVFVNVNVNDGNDNMNVGLLCSRMENPDSGYMDLDIIMNDQNLVKVNGTLTTAVNDEGTVYTALTGNASANGTVIATLEVDAEQNEVDLPWANISVNLNMAGMEMMMPITMTTEKIGDEFCRILTSMTLTMSGVDVMSEQVAIETDLAYASIATDDAVRLFSSGSEAASDWVQSAAAYAINYLQTVLQEIPAEAMTALMN